MFDNREGTMAITIGTTGDVSPEMNSTPLIDVMLVLLTLLIMTLPLQTHVISLVTAPNTRHFAPPPFATLQIDFDGTTFWNGRAVDRAILDGLFRIAAQQSPQPAIHVTADRLVRYDGVAKILADAERSGVTQIGIVGADRY
jgi:biopolymer transport protein ExbD